MSLNAVLFDLDGVLVNSHQLWWEQFTLAMEHFNRKKPTENEFKKGFLGREIHGITKDFFPEHTANELANFYIKNFHHSMHSVIPIEGAREVLEKLKKNKVKTGIVTNSYHIIARKLLQFVHFDNFFNVVIGGDDVTVGKPSPEGISLACKKLKVNPKKCIFIGDTSYDMEAGKRAGTVTIGLGIQGDKTINKLIELLALEELV